MKITFFTGAVLLALGFVGCKDIEDASPSNRDTFIKIFEGPYDMEANDLEEVPNGYVIVGNMFLPQQGSAFDSTVTVVFMTDKSGRRIGDFHYYTGGTGKSLKAFPGGYIVIGDSIKRDLNPDQVANGVISSARLLFLDEDFDKAGVFYLTDDTPSEIKTDFYGGTLTVNENGDILILGTYVDGIGTQVNIPEKPFILALNPDITFKWSQRYDLIDRNYRNSRSIHAYDNKVIWGTAITRETGDSKFSYVSIPFVEENSVFVNNSTLGEENDQLFIASDIQPAKNRAFGYGIVGTYSEPNATDGSKSNIFFIRTDANGNILPGTGRYFDAILSKDNESIDSTLSEIVDEGHALTATSDGGFVLAGTMETTPTKGNGLRDIFIIKLDAFGNVMWNKTMGGAGDEVICSIKESENGTLVLCGTNTLGSASSIFIIKIDKNGELKN